MTRSLPGALVLLMVAFVLVVGPVGTDAEPFTPECTLPWQPIAKKHSIDDTCGLEGEGSAAKHLAQNRAKNELCAPGVPVTLTYQTFKRLQKAVEDRNIPHGRNNLPDDRTPLQNIITANGQPIGEGTLVRHVAFITHAKYSNTSGGESVNCKKGGKASNDIHVELAQQHNQQACRTITAEIIPHFRPKEWEVEQLNQIRDRHPVRITGHLLFDAAHRPCDGDTPRESLKRASTWEIHPVYAIDVCVNTTIASCQATNDTKWVPLHTWVNSEQEEEDNQ